MNVRAMANDEQTGNLGIIILHRDVQSRLPVRGASGVYVGSMLKEPSAHLIMSAKRSQVQRGPLTPVPGIDAGAAADKALDDTQFALSCGLEDVETTHIRGEKIRWSIWVMDTGVVPGKLGLVGKSDLVAMTSINAASKRAFVLGDVVFA
jgi:hypothetical protein